MPEGRIGRLWAELGLRSTLSRDIGREVGVARAEAARGSRGIAQGLGGLKAIGASLTRTVTLPLLGVAGAAIKSAVDFESAFAGVRKTVDATEEEFARLRTGILDMSRVLPASKEEIAGVAEAAGQLGIQTGAILGFTRTMIDLGESTNLAAQDAANALARLANITQMPQDQFDRLGSAVVALGNKLATTEAELVEMGLRIAGAGKQIGLTEDQILSFAGALASVGINAEAGGTAISRVFLTMQKDVLDGGKQLGKFASVAGMSAAAFAQAFRDDAAGATITFIEGLERLRRQGVPVASVLKELKLGEIRVRDALMRAAGAGDLFRESLEIGSDAWRENNALTKEAAERYQTTESRLRILRNKIAAAAIPLGQMLIPALEKSVGVLATVAEGFAALPGPAKGAVTALLGIAAVVGPLLFVSTKLKLVQLELKNLATQAGLTGLAARGLSVSLSILGKAAGVAAAVGIVTEVTNAAADALHRLTRGVRDIESVKTAMLDLADGVGTVDAVLRAARIDPASNLFRNLGLDVERGASGLENMIGKLPGLESRLDFLRNTFQDLDATLAALVTTAGPAAAQAVFDGLNQKMGLNARQAELLFEDYTKATKATENQTRASELNKRASEANTRALKGQTGALGGLLGTEDDLGQWGQKAVNAFGGATAALAGLSTGSVISAASVIGALKAQARAVVGMDRTIEGLVRRGMPRRYLEQLVQMGVGGAQVLSALGDASGKQLGRVKGLFRGIELTTKSVMAAVTTQTTDFASSTLPEVTKEVKVFAGLTESEFKDWAGGVMSSVNSVSSVLDSLAERTVVNAGIIAREFGKQARALDDLNANIRKAIRRGLPDAMLKELLAMGTEGAAILAALAAASGEEFDRIIRNFRRLRRERRETRDITERIERRGPARRRPRNRKKAQHGGRFMPFEDVIVGEAGPEIARSTPTGGMEVFPERALETVGGPPPGAAAARSSGPGRVEPSEAVMARALARALEGRALRVEITGGATLDRMLGQATFVRGRR